MRHLPNIVSSMRILLALPIVLLLLQNRTIFALILFLIAAISDVVDGALARRYGATSPLGTFLDPLGDRILFMSVFVASIFIYSLAPAVVFFILFRDVVCIALATVRLPLWKKTDLVLFTTSKLGRITSLLQALTIVVLLLTNRIVAEPFIAATIIVSFTAGLEYLVNFIRSLCKPS